MIFRIEQIAIKTNNPEAAKKLLSDMGALPSWVEDTVTAHGEVWGQEGMNVADLSFNYDLITGKEFEVLHYKEGANWLWDQTTCVSHLGMHCDEIELEEWKIFFRKRGIRIAQEVFTKEHTNPAIKGLRLYNYVIFNTRDILGVDIKFIVRKVIPKRAPSLNGFPELTDRPKKSWPEQG